RGRICGRIGERASPHIAKVVGHHFCDLARGRRRIELVGWSKDQNLVTSPLRQGMAGQARGAQVVSGPVETPLETRIGPLRPRHATALPHQTSERWIEAALLD